MAPQAYNLSSDDELPSMDIIARRITSKSMKPTAGDIGKESATPRTLKTTSKTGGADPNAPDSVSKPTPLRRRKLGNPQALDNSLFQKWSDVEPSRKEKRVGLASKLRTSRLRAPGSSTQEPSEISLGNISGGISLPESDDDDITFVRRSRISPRKLSQRLRDSKPVAPISLSSSDSDSSESDEFTEPSVLQTKGAAEPESDEETEPSGLQTKPSAESEEDEETEPSGLQTKPSAESEEDEETEPSGLQTKPSAESEEDEETEPSGLQTKPSAESEEDEETEPSVHQTKASVESDGEETEPSELHTRISVESEDDSDSEFVTALSLDTEPESSDADDLPVSRTSRRQSDRQPKKETRTRRSLGGRCHAAVELEEPKPVPEKSLSKAPRKSDQGQKEKGELEDAFKKLQIYAEDRDDDPADAPRTKPQLRPLTPTKTLAPSPTKGPAIPLSPWKPEESEFWDPEVQNKWIDDHSPSKPPSPKKLIIDDENVNTKAAMKLKYGTSPEKRNAKKAFEARKDAIARDFLAELDERITSGQLAKLAASTGGIRIQWSTTLQSTAGRAHWKCKEKTVTAEQPDGSLQTVKERQHTAHIELASKVLTNEHDLLNTVAHEFCHLATFMLDGKPKFAHGAEFKAWGRKCVAAFGGRGIDVTTKHNYEIEYKYIWRCADCTTEVHRHSKSVDPAKHRCGRCRGVLEQVKPVPRGGGGGAKGGAAPGPRKKTAYQEFCSQEMKAIKAEGKALTFKDMMALVSVRWKAQQAAKAAAGPGADAAKEPVVAEVAEELEELVIADLST